MRRAERLSETLRAEIGEIVGYELDDPRIQSATVTDVRVAEDLRDARVFVLIEGTEQEIREAMKALHHAEKFVRSQLALNLNLNHAPHIHFVRDTLEEKASRVDRLFEELNAGKEVANNDEPIANSE